LALELPVSASAIAVITGASSGIGLATAELFLAAGWQVLALSRRPCSLAGVHNVLVDLQAPDLAATVAQGLFEALEKACAGPARKIALVHNAAQFLNDSALELNPQDLLQLLQVNVVASAVLNKVVVPFMDAGSSITYVGSTLSEKAVANTASYCISKHAVVGLMRATCQDLLGRRIHTTCVCPGFVDTPMLRAGRTDEAMAPFSALTAYQKILQPEEVAQIIWNAANTPALNGAVVHANYGQIEH
jgi:3-oxoacyl-[acyl-carrier protein] reductase